MARDDSQERTEDATDKRKRESREKGQIARSKELNTMMLTIASALLLMAMGTYVAGGISAIFYECFTLDRQIIFDSHKLLDKLIGIVEEVAVIISPVLIMLMGVSVFSTVIMGGMIFSTEALAPKLERLDPIKGVKKIISLKALMELFKTLLKFILVTMVFMLVISYELDNIFALDDLPIEQGLKKSLEILLMGFLLMGIGLIVIAIIDVPFQIWDHARQLKMTKQEIKDESKDTDGKPEVKGKQRQIQREMAKRRQMNNVPTADVIITNPEHYAVAIRYEQGVTSAPIVVAKGVDLIAGMIRKVAKAHKIPFVRAPELARSIYYHVEIEEEIPSGLYIAVAQVLAYVYELKQFKQGQGSYPEVPRNLQIPKEMRR